VVVELPEFEASSRLYRNPSCSFASFIKFVHIE
jgi:hypothetical protein